MSVFFFLFLPVSREIFSVLLFLSFYPWLTEVILITAPIVAEEINEDTIFTVHGPSVGPFIISSTHKSGTPS